MNKPNYKNGSIVNLMASIKFFFGGKSDYEPLKSFNISDISKNIVLIVIDGLGYEYLVKYGKHSFLYKNLKGKMTSVFPATTASAMTAYSTGLAPAQHGLTGWFMYLKEIGAISVILPFTTRSGGFNLEKGNIKFKDIYNARSFFQGLKATSISIKHNDYIDSEYNRLVEKGAKKLSFLNLNGFFKQINKALRVNKRRKFVFAYWGKFDSLCHRKGTNSKEVKRHFIQLDKRIKFLAESLKNKNTTIIVSADHGLINTKEKDKVIKLEDYPKFLETLAMPLSGEPRAVYCYVRPDKIKQFENYVKTEFNKCCEMHKSEDLIKKNYFGLFKPDKKLKDRIGDYILIMKENYIMKDLVLGEKRNIYIGNHGGVSEEEMFVPLVVIN
ncbi:MAG: alkaline phosphatase family protein [bacterium]|nr:alkaline phosphatase family protein [bacterium]